MLVLGAIGAGCVHAPLSKAPSDNPEVQVDTLFTHDGCTVYRFEDNGFHYYVRCRQAEPAATSSMVPCGDNCERPEQIQTLSAEGR